MHPTKQQRKFKQKVETAIFFFFLVALLSPICQNGLGNMRAHKSSERRTVLDVYLAGTGTILHADITGSDEQLSSHRPPF